MNVQALFSLEGKVALITGGARGIGKALAEGFTAAGAKVYIADRLKEQGEATAQLIGAQFIEADLAKPEAVAALVTQLNYTERHLDTLVNNAGVEIIAPLEALDLSILQKTLDVNLTAAILLTQGCLPLLKSAHTASIINVTSIHDTVPYRHNAAYNLSKAALAMFTKTMAIELAVHGIRVNNLAPGAVETDINRHVLDEIGRDKFAEWIPLGRVASVSEVVGPAIFLASEAASYITGATLYTDGGYMQNTVRYQPEHPT